MKKPLILMIGAASLLLAGVVSAQSGADLVKAKNCMGCHDMEAKKAGPSFKDIAAKYKDNKTAEATITAKLKDGKGHMKVAASDAEMKTMVQFSLTGK